MTPQAAAAVAKKYSAFINKDINELVVNRYIYPIEDRPSDIEWAGLRKRIVASKLPKPYLNTLLGIFYALKGEQGNSYKFHDDALRESPNDSGLFQAYINSMSNLRQLEDAIELAKTAFDRFSDPWYLYKIGEINQYMGGFSNALHFFEKYQVVTKSKIPEYEEMLNLKKVITMKHEEDFRRLQLKFSEFISGKTDKTITSNGINILSPSESCIFTITIDDTPEVAAQLTSDFLFEADFDDINLELLSKVTVQALSHMECN